MPKQDETIEKLDQALTEIDVLDNTEKAVFRIDAETFRLEQVDFKLIENHKEAFDIEMMEERFTDYLLKYDYIVGDIGYEKLRLRGFYDDQRKGVPLDMKISNLEDYLVEYCNFGCPYFVFERIEKKEEDPESYFKRNKKNKQAKSSKRKNKHKGNKNQAKNRRKPSSKKKQPGQQNKAKDFQVVKKEETQKKQAQVNKEKQQGQIKKKDQKKQFKIRKKND